MTDKLIVALDMDNRREAEKLVSCLSGCVKIFKIGKELFTAEGPEIVRMVHKYGARVFLDLKFHDIPHTVEKALRAAAALDVFICNVHVLGGRAMLKAAAGAVRGSGKELRVVGVTLLTSMDRGALGDLGITKSPQELVLKLALLAKECGLAGVVASALEAPAIRKLCGKNFLIITPGIRPAGSDAGGQKRIATPGEAVKNGADYVVVGRPVTEAGDPLTAARNIIKEMA